MFRNLVKQFQLHLGMLPYKWERYRESRQCVTSPNTFVVVPESTKTHPELRYYLYILKLPRWNLHCEKIGKEHTFTLILLKHNRFSWCLHKYSHGCHIKLNMILYHPTMLRIKWNPCKPNTIKFLYNSLPPTRTGY